MNVGNALSGRPCENLFEEDVCFAIQKREGCASP